MHSPSVFLPIQPVLNYVPYEALQESFQSIPIISNIRIDISSTILYHLFKEMGFCRVQPYGSIGLLVSFLFF